MTSEQALIEKIRSLSPQRAAEVADFVDFLTERDETQEEAEEAEDAALRFAAAKLSEPIFREAWDNDDDAVYDRL